MTNFIINTFVLNKKSSQSVSRKKYVMVCSIVGIISNVFLSICKILCGALFFSISILGDGINNLSDSGSSIITLIGFKMSEKPADREHPFGHARLEYISGFIISFVILFVAGQLFLSSFDKIINPIEFELTILSVIVLVFSMAIKFWLYLFNRQIGNTINSKAIIGVSKDALNDIFITLGVLVSSAIYYFFNINLDGYVGALLALIIAKSGLELAKDTLSPIIGEAPDKKFISDISNKIMTYEKVLGIHDLIVHSYGEEKYFATVHIEFDAKLEFIVCHEIADKIERDFEKTGIQLVVHSDPVLTDNKQFDEYKNAVITVLKNIDNSLGLHGFRYIETDDGTKLLFDVELPNNITLSPESLIELIQKNINSTYENFECIIRVDKNYNYL